jgi:hypothetical protein
MSSSSVSVKTLFLEMFIDQIRHLKSIQKISDVKNVPKTDPVYKEFLETLKASLQLLYTNNVLHSVRRGILKEAGLDTESIVMASLIPKYKMSQLIQAYAQCASVFIQKYAHFMLSINALVFSYEYRESKQPIFWATLTVYVRDDDPSNELKYNTWSIVNKVTDYKSFKLRPFKENENKNL